jgi:hypothetical protein
VGLRASLDMVVNFKNEKVEKMTNEETKWQNIYKTWYRIMETHTRKVLTEGERGMEKTLSQDHWWKCQWMVTSVEMRKIFKLVHFNLF